MDKTSLKTNAWIRLWGAGMALMGLIWHFLVPGASGLLFASFGAILFFCPHTYIIYQVTRVILIILVAGTFFGTYVAVALTPSRILQIYYPVAGLFYAAFLFFILQRNVRNAFNPPEPKPLLVLEAKDEKNFKFIIRLIALIILTQGVYFSPLGEWITTQKVTQSTMFGLPHGVVEFILSLLFFWGLFFFRQNLGRRPVIFFTIFAIIYEVASIWRLAEQGSYQYTSRLVGALFNIFVIVFLFHPKTKAMFQRRNVSTKRHG